MDSLSSQLQQLRSELATEQDLRAAEASKAAAAQDALSSTVKSLEEEASRVATVHCKELHDARAKIQELTKPLPHRQHAAAEETSTASEAKRQERQYASSQPRRARWQDSGVHRVTRAVLQECRASNGGDERNIANAKGTLLLYEAEFGHRPKTAAELVSFAGRAVSYKVARQLGPPSWSE